MSFLSNLRKRFDSKRVTLQLDDIQGLILRSRPEPYVGIHAMLHVDDAAGGCDLIGRLAGHVPSAEGWTEDMPAWMGVALSHAGLKALGLPDKLAEILSSGIPAGHGRPRRPASG